MTWVHLHSPAVALVDKKDMYSTAAKLRQGKKKARYEKRKRDEKKADRREMNEFRVQRKNRREKTMKVLGSIL